MITMNHHHHQIQQQQHQQQQSQSFFGSPPPSDHMFNFTTWKPFPPPDITSPSSSSAAAAYHHHDFNPPTTTTTVDEGNPIRTQGGLSLSLSSSTIGVQPYQQQEEDQMGNLQSGDHVHHPAAAASLGFFHHHQQQQQQQQQFQFQRAPLPPPSRYLGAAQELLNEFCSLKQIDSSISKAKQSLKSNLNQIDAAGDGDDANVSPRNINHGGDTQQQHQCSTSVGSVEFLDLQKRKTKLLSLLSEVDRKYKHYCSQMKAVVSSFESVAGAGAATVYSALASKAMSRHFRCLRDGIVTQIQSTKKAMGEKDPVVPGTTKGETPRLKVVDQAVRQQRAFQQMNSSMVDSQPWRPQRGLPERSVSLLRAWLFEHFLHPYPSDVDKHILARQTGLSRSQVSNWFINARVRLWKPMVEELYMEETKENELDFQNLIMSSSEGPTPTHTDNHPLQHHDNTNNNNIYSTEQKPTHDQLVRIDSDCLSSIISPNPDHKNDHNHQHHHHQLSPHHGFGTFGAVELDFSSSNYNHHHHHDHQSAEGGVSYAEGDHHLHQQLQGDVSLTLGLQQHGLASQTNTLFFQRDHHHSQIDQEVQYSVLLDGPDEGGVQNLPYRNLMGGGHQLLHDLAG